MLRGCQLLVCMGKVLVLVCKAQECTRFAAVSAGAASWAGDLGCHFFLFLEGKSVGGHGSPRAG